MVYLHIHKITTFTYKIIHISHIHKITYKCMHTCHIHTCTHIHIHTHSYIHTFSYIPTPINIIPTPQMPTLLPARTLLFFLLPTMTLLPLYTYHMAISHHQ